MLPIHPHMCGHLMCSSTISQPTNYLPERGETREDLERFW